MCKDRIKSGCPYQYDSSECRRCRYRNRGRRYLILALSLAAYIVITAIVWG